ncbi:MAG: hypothetical protein NC180_10970 [Muribaculaceae bacterium]|nr:hypothetical protein [Roseburia sp.]MCM1432012.1 hypothetical protein [Muribaculaceae bacterium]MCM1493734.1 hypothetical protein [Muribaculaceae bacterium]
MKVGVNEATELKALAERLELPFANLLWGYVLEDLMLRVCASAYREHLWLRSERPLGEEAYRRGTEPELSFFYRESSRLPAPEKLVPGQMLTTELGGQMLREIFDKPNKREVCWEGAAAGEAGAVTLELGALYRGMRVPVTMRMRTLADANQRPETRQIAAAAIEGAKIVCQVYSADNRVSHDLFEIFEKLELIGDMGAYFRVYQALKTQPLSGRYLMEEMQALTEKKPQVKKEKRILQLAGYKNYAYMRRRWEQYVKRQREEAPPWEEALELVLRLAGPLWLSLCRGEVFLDDWMPELGRYM